MPILGQCRLCLTDAVELQRSHSIPAAVYRALRGDSETENPNPLLVQTWGVVQTSRQPTAHLLCAVCEQRFSIAERWVMNHGLQRDDTFPLCDMLRGSGTLIIGRSDFAVYDVSGSQDIDISHLAVFALSIFWRYAVYKWPHAEGERIVLGPYQEIVRSFLLGKTPFPPNVVLSVALRPVSSVVRLVRVPQTNRVDGVRAHGFLMLGYVFTLFCGKNIPERFRKFCVVNAPFNPILVTERLENTFLHSAIRSLDRAEATQARSDLRSSRKT